MPKTPDTEPKIVIVEEPRQDTYRELLRFAAARCEQFLLVWREQLRFKPSAQTIATTLEPYLVRQSATSVWPGTRTSGHKAALVRYYRADRAAVQALEITAGLYAWLSPDYPEDLAFYSSTGAVWLATVSHEQMGWFEDTGLSRPEILRHVPNLKLRP